MTVIGPVLAAPLALSIVSKMLIIDKKERMNMDSTIHWDLMHFKDKSVEVLAPVIWLTLYSF